jgi:hypothetical protein
MSTEAWKYKELNTALASWTQLRHDTILYAKQSYTMLLGISEPLDSKLRGYVEPILKSESCPEEPKWISEYSV